MSCLNLDLFFGKQEGVLDFASGNFKRIKQHFNPSCSKLVDIHADHGVMIHFLRVTSEGETKKLSISGTGNASHVLESGEFGILLRINHEDHWYTIWLPSTYGQFFPDNNQRLTMPDNSFLSYQWQFRPHILFNLLLPGRIGEFTFIPYIVLEDTNEQFFEELKSFNEIERRLYRKSDWFFAETPSDVWKYLINGSIYDPRSHKGIDKRFKCQQCAYAWWCYFGFLYEKTGKKIYDIMQDEVAYTVLLDMSAEGEWGHGYWSDNIETHTRFHIDGIHLLISQYEKTGKPTWLEAAELGMAFISDHLMEQLDNNCLWFLHDTMEHRMRHHFKSTLFGKSIGNSLTINTHVQTLTALHRLTQSIPDKKIYSEMLENGVRALRRVIDYQPADVIYRMLMFLIMKYKTNKKGLSISGKLKNYLVGLIIPKIFWSLRHRFPRIVYPGGFTERDLTLSFASDRYHITNMKDFLTLYQQEQFIWLHSYIKNGYAFLSKFFDKMDLTNALSLSPYYIEFIDILYLYNKLIEHVPPEEIDSIKEKIYQQTGGYSLDYYASELVRGK